MTEEGLPERGEEFPDSLILGRVFHVEEAA